MNKTIYFRTRGGPTQGWGNVFRLCSFAAYCRRRGNADVLFFVEGPREVSDYLRKADCAVCELSEDISVADESRIFEKYPPAELIIMEMIDCNFQRQEMLKKHTQRLVVFDDLLDHRYCADLVVCGQQLPCYGNIDISSPGTLFLTGYDYFLCRPEFLQFATRQRHYAEQVKRVLISLGGGRYDAGYIKAAHALVDRGKNIMPTFVLGYDGQDGLREELKRIVPHAIVYGGVTNLEELFWETDLAIVSGGYNKFEAAITGTPAVMIAVQWHQIPLAEEFSRCCDMPFAGYMGFVTKQDIKAGIDSLLPLAERTARCGQAREVIDGKGFERVYAGIFK